MTILASKILQLVCSILILIESMDPFKKQKLSCKSPGYSNSISKFYSLSH